MKTIDGRELGLELPSGPFDVLIADSHLQRDEWKEIRRTKGVSASMVPVAMGINPYTSQLRGWAWYRGLQDDPEETGPMWWGSKLQDILVQKVADDEGLVALRDERLLVSQKHPLFLATPDAWYFKQEDLSEDSLAEAKTTRKAKMWEDGIPEHIFCQVQAQLFVTDRTVARVPVYFREESEDKWGLIHRDDAYIENLMIPMVEEFWHKVQNNIAPESDGSPDARDAIKALYPSTLAGKIVAVPLEFSEIYDKIKALSKEKDGIEKQIEALKDRVKMRMENAEVANIEGSDLAFTYKETSRAGYVVEPTKYRTLRLAKRKD